MKKHLTCIGIGLSLLLSAPSAKAVLLAYEGFDYAPGETFVGKNGGLGFETAWLAANPGMASNAIVVAGSFTYTDAFGFSVPVTGNRAWVTGHGTAEGDNFPGGVAASSNPWRRLAFARGLDSTPTTTWASVIAIRTGQPYLYQAPDGKTAYFGRGVGALQFFYNATAGSTAQGSEMVSIGRGSENTSGIDPNRNVDTWAVLNRGSAAQQVTSTVHFTNQPPAFLLMRIDHKPGIGPHTNALEADRIYLWINPPNLLQEPDINSADLTLTPIQFQTTNDRDYIFNVIRLFGGNFNTTVGYSSVQVDEIRIGTEWIDVVPEPSSAGLVLLGGLTLLWWRRRAH